MANAGPDSSQPSYDAFLIENAGANAVGTATMMRAIRKWTAIGGGTATLIGICTTWPALIIGGITAAALIVETGIINRSERKARIAHNHLTGRR